MLKTVTGNGKQVGYVRVQGIDLQATGREQME